MRLAYVLNVALSLLSLTALGAGCGDPDAPSTDEDLTSKTARARSITFEGLLYLPANASDSEVQRAVDSQARSAFGPMRTSSLSVATRELKAVRPEAITKRNVNVVAADGTKTPKTEVRFTYEDQALAGSRHDGASTAPLALLAPGYQSQKERILRECTPNDSHARDFGSSLWYVFEPSLPSCQTAMRAEQATIDAARARLEAPDTDVAEVESSRLYLPITAKLGPDETNKRKAWPEYKRLFSGGVAQDRVVVSIIQGLVAHGLSGSPADDYGYGEYMDLLSELFAVHPKLDVTKVEPAEDLATYVLKSGKTVQNVRIHDIVRWYQTGRYPETLTSAEHTEIRDLAAKRLYLHWLTLEVPLTVSIGGAAARDMTIEVRGYFGVEQDAAPYRHAVKSSDVFLYSGHSYIGAGPLDPSRFKPADFPSSYQLFFVNGCVSYNYYHGGFVTLKVGGTKNLDLISNGLETPAYNSGSSTGRLVARLLDGSNASYEDLLVAARATDKLRVVDGELDNEFSPESDAIKLSPR
ncbi:MAG TPA: hypothetical protein VM925_24175 [Labilithrix sp.]|nr:hypothetical protein [Labilithrix sp.]